MTGGAAVTGGFIGMFRQLARLGVTRAAAFFYAVAVGVAANIVIAHFSLQDPAHPVTAKPQQLSPKPGNNPIATAVIPPKAEPAEAAGDGEQPDRSSRYCVRGADAGRRAGALADRATACRDHLGISRPGVAAAEPAAAIGAGTGKATRHDRGDRTATACRSRSHRRAGQAADPGRADLAVAAGGRRQTGRPATGQAARPRQRRAVLAAVGFVAPYNSRRYQRASRYFASVVFVL